MISKECYYMTHNVSGGPSGPNYVPPQGDAGDESNVGDSMLEEFLKKLAAAKGTEKAAAPPVADQETSAADHTQGDHSIPPPHANSKPLIQPPPAGSAAPPQGAAGVGNSFFDASPFVAFSLIFAALEKQFMKLGFSQAQASILAIAVIAVMAKEIKAAILNAAKAAADKEIAQAVTCFVQAGIQIATAAAKVAMIVPAVSKYKSDLSAKKQKVVESKSKADTAAVKEKASETRVQNHPLHGIGKGKKIPETRAALAGGQEVTTGTGQLPLTPTQLKNVREYNQLVADHDVAKAKSAGAAKVHTEAEGDAKQFAGIGSAFGSVVLNAGQMWQVSPMDNIFNVIDNATKGAAHVASAAFTLEEGFWNGFKSQLETFLRVEQQSQEKFDKQADKADQAFTDLVQSEMRATDENFKTFSLGGHA